MKAFVPTKYKVDGGRTRIVLKISFDSTKESAEQDFLKAEVFSMKFDGNETVFKAVDEEDLDAKGTYIPRLLKKIYFSGLSMELAENSEFVKEGLEEWAEFEENAEVRPMYEDGVFLGAASIRVKRFKKVLSRARGYLDLPGIEWIEQDDMTDGRWVKTGQKVSVVATFTGHTEEERAVYVHRPQRPRHCFYCLKNGHTKWECPKLKYFNCRTCGSCYNGCTRDKCTKINDIYSGNFTSKATNAERNRKFREDKVKGKKKASKQPDLAAVQEEEISVGSGTLREQLQENGVDIRCTAPKKSSNNNKNSVRRRGSVGCNSPKAGDFLSTLSPEEKLEQTKCDIKEAVLEEIDNNNLTVSNCASQASKLFKSFAKESDSDEAKKVK